MYSSDTIKRLTEIMNFLVTSIVWPPAVQTQYRRFAADWPSAPVATGYLGGAGETVGQKRRMQASFMLTPAANGTRPIETVIDDILGKSKQAALPGDVVVFEAFGVLRGLVGNADYVVSAYQSERDWRGPWFKTRLSSDRSARVYGMASLPKGGNGIYIGHVIPLGERDNDGFETAFITPGYVMLPAFDEDEMFVAALRQPDHIGPRWTEQILIGSSPRALRQAPPAGTFIQRPTGALEGGLPAAVAAFDALLTRLGLAPLKRTPEEWAALVAPCLTDGSIGQFMKEQVTLALNREGGAPSYPSTDIGEIIAALMAIFNETPQPDRGGLSASAQMAAQQSAARTAPPDPPPAPAPRVRLMEVSDLLDVSNRGELAAGLSAAAEAAGVDLDWDGERRIAGLTFREQQRTRPIDMVRLIGHLSKSGIAGQVGWGGELATGLVESMREEINAFDRPWNKAVRRIVPFVCRSFPGEEDAWVERPLPGTDLVVRAALEERDSYTVIDAGAPGRWGVTPEAVLLSAETNGMARPTATWMSEGLPIRHVDMGFSSGVLLSLIATTRHGQRSILAVAPSRDYVAWYDLEDDRAAVAPLILALMIQDTLESDNGADGTLEILFIDRGTVREVELGLEQGEPRLAGPTDLVSKIASLSGVPLDAQGRLPLPEPPPSNEDLMVGEREGLREQAQHDLEAADRRARPGRLESRADVLAAKANLTIDLVGDEGWYPDFETRDLNDVVNARCAVARLLLRAAPYLWDDGLRDEAAAMPLSQHIVSTQLLPLPLPLWFTWARPVEVELVDEDHAGIAKGVITSMMVVPADGGLIIHTMGRRMGQRWLHTSILPRGSRFPEDLPGTARLPLSLLSFLVAPFVDASPRRPAKGGGHGESAKRVPDDEPRFVRLREARHPDRPSGQGEGGHRDWNIRWVVQRHRRFQPYPSIGESRWIWIDAYIKGPPDKPLKHSVYKVEH